jgi:hypothetical protein
VRVLLIWTSKLSTSITEIPIGVNANPKLAEKAILIACEPVKIGTKV